MSKEDIYFLADLHITADPPVCRLETEEEWFQVETDRIKEVAEIVGEGLLVIAGDIIDTWKTKNSQAILNMLSDNLPKNTVWTMGNHEVKGCGQDREMALQEGTFGTMTRMQGLRYITEPFEWFDCVIYPHDFRPHKTLDHSEVNTEKTNIAVSHFLSFPDKIPKHWGKVEDAWTAPSILKEFPEYDLIVVGDYHIPFKIDNRYLSPGSLTRRSVKQIDYTPAIWRFREGILTPIYLTIKPAEECMTQEHKVKKEIRNQRMEQWGEDLKQEHDVTGDFEEDLEVHFVEEETIEPVKELMHEFIMEVKGDG